MELSDEKYFLYNIVSNFLNKGQGVDQFKIVDFIEDYGVAVVSTFLLKLKCHQYLQSSTENRKTQTEWKADLAGLSSFL